IVQIVCRQRHLSYLTLVSRCVLSNPAKLYGGALPPANASLTRCHALEALTSAPAGQGTAARHYRATLRKPRCPASPQVARHSSYSVPSPLLPPPSHPN